MYYLTNYDSIVGELTIASDGENITGLWIKDQKYFEATLNKESIKQDDLPIFKEVKKSLDKYFKGEKTDFSRIALKPEGSAFRQEVWKLLCEIPYGELVTYGDIAKKIALKLGKKTMSGQAVGGAVGHNPISILIPCHRVIGINKSLTGYAGGIDKKIKLLELEGIDIAKYKVPTKGTAIG